MIFAGILQLLRKISFFLRFSLAVAFGSEPTWPPEFVPLRPPPSASFDACDPAISWSNAGACLRLRWSLRWLWSSSFSSEGFEAAADDEEEGDDDVEVKVSSGEGIHLKRRKK